MILLSTAYFPPVQYCSKLINNKTIYIEQHENFIRQTYRNRTVILAANDPTSLVIPVVKGRAAKIKMKDLQISYDENWQHTHWQSIVSAYNSSPFLEYYIDDIEPFFRKKYKYLLDLNMSILNTICELLEIDPKIYLTEEFEQIHEGTLNYRDKFHPKQSKNSKDPCFIAEQYTQVFTEKFGFVSNLSILDLLFNAGPQTYSILENSIR